MLSEGDIPKHADLVDDMVPVAWCLQLLGKDVIELVPHAYNAMGHCLYVAFPFLKQVGIAENQRNLSKPQTQPSNRSLNGYERPHQSRTVRGRVANLTSLQHGKLTLDAIRRILRWRNNVQCADTFAIQACILSKALQWQ